MLQTKHDEKLFSRFLSKENSKAEPSFGVLYYGGSSGTIPFMWESQPGTPKHPLSQTSLPTLTPPPSYQSTTTPKTKPTQKSSSRTKFLSTLFPRFPSKKINYVAPSFSSSFASSSSSFSSSSTPMNAYVHRRGCLSRSRSSVPFGFDDDDEMATKSPTSTLCFGGRLGFFKEFRGSRS
ncbi:Mastermind-like protein [Actinidia chinensis var. chinensis]|uniref:Mastermind-like protein n=1 Tax=Actinidia chinensis var. chinensis TaxID=1590841 RepID=A0A2R6RWN3_ACTCC|nr:Mastermind-like protein [Actinidia chinensis var. chinensis]